ncbi:hypothetical protein ACWC2T_30075 [Streptomyces sp. NPDC001393]
MTADAHASLRYRREYAGFSVEEFAERLGVTTRAVRATKACSVTAGAGSGSVVVG